MEKESGRKGKLKTIAISDQGMEAFDASLIASLSCGNDDSEREKRVEVDQTSFTFAPKPLS